MIPKIKHIILIKLITDTHDYKKAASTVNVLEKSAHWLW